MQGILTFVKNFFSQVPHPGDKTVGQISPILGDIQSGGPHKIFPSTKQPKILEKARKRSLIHCLLFFTYFEVLIPLTVTVSKCYSDMLITLVKCLQTPLDVIKPCYKISVLEELPSRLLHFKFLPLSFHFFFFFFFANRPTHFLERERERAMRNIILWV